MNEKKPRLKFLDKLKNVKHIEIYIAIIFVIIILLIFFSNTNKPTKAKVAETKDMSVSSYVSTLENDLEDVLSNIGGISNVKVLITLDMAGAEVLNSLINLSTFPPVKGIVVTAKGVNNTTNRLKVLKAIEAVVDVKNGSVEILPSD